jgi:hypothetical protein
LGLLAVLTIPLADPFATPITLPASASHTLIPTPVIHGVFIRVLALALGLTLTVFPVITLVGQVFLEEFPDGPVTLIVLEKGVLFLQNKSVSNNKTKKSHCITNLSAKVIQANRWGNSIQQG